MAIVAAIQRRNYDSNKLMRKRVKTRMFCVFTNDSVVVWFGYNSQSKMVSYTRIGNCVIHARKAYKKARYKKALERAMARDAKIRDM